MAALSSGFELSKPQSLKSWGGIAQSRDGLDYSRPQAQDIRTYGLHTTVLRDGTLIFQLSFFHVLYNMYGGIALLSEPLRSLISKAFVSN